MPKEKVVQPELFKKRVVLNVEIGNSGELLDKWAKELTECVGEISDSPFNDESTSH